MSADPLTAAQFVERVKKDAFKVGTTTRVIGEVSLRGETLKHPLILHGFEFEGPVDLSDTSVPGEMDLSDCYFHRTLTMNQVQVDGSVRFRRIRVMAAGGNADSSVRGIPEFAAEGLTANGRITLEQFTCEGAIDLADARSGGVVRLHNVKADKLNVAGLQAGGDLEVKDLIISSEACFTGARTIGNFNVENLYTKWGNLKIGYVRAGAVRLKDVKAARLEAVGLQAGGDLEVNGLTTKGKASFNGASTTGSFELKGLDTWSDLELANVRVGQNLVISNAESAKDLSINTEMLNKSEINDPELFGTNQLRGNVDLSGSAISGRLEILNVCIQHAGIPYNLNLSFSTVNGTTNIKNVIVKGNLWAISAKLTSGIWIESLAVGGCLDVSNMEAVTLTFGPGVRESKLGRINGYGLSVKLGIKLSHLTVGPSSDPAEWAAVALPGAKAHYISFRDGSVRAEQAKPTMILGGVDLSLGHFDTRVELSGMTVDGDINLVDTRIGTHLLAQRWAQSTLRQTERGGENIRYTRLAPTRAAGLKIDRAHVGGEADLSGLELRGSLQAEGLEVAEELCLADCRDFRRKAHARIQGQARLMDSQLGRLSVSGHSFESDEWSQALILNGATIGTFEIHPTEAGGVVYPKPLGLKNLTVQHWELPEEDRAATDLPVSQSGARVLPKAVTFAKLFENDNEVSIPTYQGAIKSLKDNGQDDEAAELYRRMRRRALQKEGSYHRGWQFYDKGVGFGTEPWKLLYPIFLLALLCLFVTLPSANSQLGAPQAVARALLERPVGKDIARVAGKPSTFLKPVPCSFIQRLAVTFMLAAPVAGSDRQVGCRLQDTAQTEILGITSMFNIVGKYSPAGFEQLMKVFFIALWAPLLAFLLKRAFRD